jgi:hypothetical protein
MFMTSLATATMICLAAAGVQISLAPAAGGPPSPPTGSGNTVAGLGGGVLSRGGSRDVVYSPPRRPRPGTGRAAARKFEIPTLPWPLPLPPDWASVTAVGGAKGDGHSDDTAAIQATIDLYSTCKDPGMNATATGQPLRVHTCGAAHGTPCSTVFFPAGTYRISKPIYVGHCEGLVLLGTGATTTIEWGGPAGTAMFISNGTVFGRWEGIVWDGRHTAKWGVSYNSTHGSLFETRELHRNSRFSNFLDAGISVGVTNDGVRGMSKKETAEALVQNCIFENSYKGVALQDFNDYDWAIDGCTFTNNSFGIYSHTHMDSNYDVHSCRFEGSLVADLTVAAEASNVRQVVSVNSFQFLATLQGGEYHSPLQIHDCRVANWSGPSAISFDLRGPLTVTNNEFTSSPSQRATNNISLVVMKQGGTPSYSASLLEGGNLLDGKPVDVTTAGGLFTGGPNLKTESIAGAMVTSSDILTVATRFDRKTWPGPKKVLDCTASPYLANTSLDCVQQHAAIQACVTAAAQAGKATMAYLPGGAYKICKPLEILAGEDFFFRGAGYATTIELGQPAPPPPPGPHPTPPPGPPGPPGPHPPPPPRPADPCKMLPPKSSTAFKVVTNGTCTTHGLFDINSEAMCASGAAAVGFHGSTEQETFIDGCYMSTACNVFMWCPPNSGKCQHTGPVQGYCAVICATTKPPPAPPPPPSPPGPHPTPPGPPHPPHPPPPPCGKGCCHRPPNCMRGQPNHCESGTLARSQRSFCVGAILVLTVH